MSDNISFLPLQALVCALTTKLNLMTMKTASTALPVETAVRPSASSRVHCWRKNPAATRSVVGINTQSIAAKNQRLCSMMQCVLSRYYSVSSGALLAVIPRDKTLFCFQAVSKMKEKETRCGRKKTGSFTKKKQDVVGKRTGSFTFNFASAKKLTEWFLSKTQTPVEDSCKDSSNDRRLVFSDLTQWLC